MIINRLSFREALIPVKSFIKIIKRIYVAANPGKNGYSLL